MTIGPGKYDRECMALLESTQADAVAIMVGGGNKGSGFSCNIKATSLAEHLESGRQMVRVLREVADAVEADLVQVQRTMGS